MTRSYHRPSPQAHAGSGKGNPIMSDLSAVEPCSDFSEALDSFVARLMEVGDLIRGRDVVFRAKEIYEEIQEMADLYETWLKDEGPIEDEEQAWWDFWLYLGSKIRGWWD